MSETDDFSRCLLMNTAKAARALTRRYDRRLQPYGITVAQFALLVKTRHHGGTTISALADRFAIDRTSLTRNMDLLERRGLIRREKAPSGNGRLCFVTAEGEKLVEQTVPEWRKAQQEMRELLSGFDIDDYLKTMEILTKG